MSNMYYDGTVEIDNNGICIEVEVHAEATGYYKAGDSFGYGCEPPDEDFEIDEIEYRSAIAYDEEGNTSDVDITDEIKKSVKSKLHTVEFEECVFEPDYDDYYEW